MIDEPNDMALQAAEMAAAELVAQVKSMKLDEFELPIIDQSCAWVVAVKRIGIKAEG
jgi:hypothetical protein